MVNHATYRCTLDMETGHKVEIETLKPLSSELCAELESAGLINVGVYSPHSHSTKPDTRSVLHIHPFDLVGIMERGKVVVETGRTISYTTKVRWTKVLPVIEVDRILYAENTDVPVVSLQGKKLQAEVDVRTYSDQLALAKKPGL